MQAMKRADMEPIVIEDLVKFGEDLGIARGALENARQALTDVLSARGLTPNQSQLDLIERESSLTRLPSWLRSAATAASSSEAIKAE